MKCKKCGRIPFCTKAFGPCSEECKEFIKKGKINIKKLELINKKYKIE